MDWNASLVKAASNGNLSKVKEALFSGANIHAYDDQALRWATECNRLEVTKYLIENGADVHALNDYALRWASYNGHLEVVKYLIANGANIHAFDDEALRWASKRGYLEVVKYLLSLDDINYWLTNSFEEIRKITKEHYELG